MAGNHPLKLVDDCAPGARSEENWQENTPVSGSAESFVG